MRVGIEPIDSRSKKSRLKKKATKPECLNGNCEPHIITVEDILATSVLPKETSGAEAIAPLFENIIGSLCEGSSCDACNECNGERRIISGESEKDPCKGCDGNNCPLLEKVGITCMGIEGLKVIPSTEVIN